MGFYFEVRSSVVQGSGHAASCSVLVWATSLASKSLTNHIQNRVRELMYWERSRRRTLKVRRLQQPTFTDLHEENRTYPRIGNVRHMAQSRVYTNHTETSQHMLVGGIYQTTNKSTLLSRMSEERK